MGATNIDATLSGDLNPNQVKDWFRAQQREDAIEYGEDPYNGSWSTIEDIKIDGQIFDDYDQAYEYALEHSEKWAYCYAVRYKTSKKVKETTQINWLIVGLAAC